MAWMKQPLGEPAILSVDPQAAVHLQKPEANSIVSGGDNLDSRHGQWIAPYIPICLAAPCAF